MCVEPEPGTSPLLTELIVYNRSHSLCVEPEPANLRHSIIPWNQNLEP